MDPERGNAYVLPESSTAATQWVRQESKRLRTMRDLVGVVARQDLGPVLGAVIRRAAGRPVELIDLGAGPDGDIEVYCRENGIGYTAYDGNEAFLAQRRAAAQAAGWPVDPARTILGRLEDMSALPDASYDLSFSRAATAWSADPDATIAEQLRITRHAAVFTEYDWTYAGVGGTDPDAVAAANAAKFAMVLVLESAGFRTEFGATLPQRVARIASRGTYAVAHTSARHELPVVDHRSVFADTAETILSLLRTANSGGDAARSRVIAERLAYYLRIVTEAAEGSLAFRLPALVTEIVHITSPGHADALA